MQPRLDHNKLTPPVSPSTLFTLSQNVVYSVFLIWYSGTIKCSIVIYGNEFHKRTNNAGRAVQPEICQEDSDASCNRLCVFLKVAPEQQSCASAWVASVEAKTPRTHRIGKTGCQRKYPTVSWSEDLCMMCQRESLVSVSTSERLFPGMVALWLDRPRL